MMASSIFRVRFMTFGNFVSKQVYNRQRDLHQPYGGQEQGGIITPAAHPVIFAITGENGLQHGYHDSWTDDGSVFLYYGEGRKGPMTFIKGNKAIRDHLINGKDLLLFEKIKRSGGLRFIGQFICTGASQKLAPDSERKMRTAIVFHLVPMGALEETDNDEQDAQIDTEFDLAQLRLRAMEAASNGNEEPAEGARRRIYQRSEAVRRYVLARAAGVCECCKAPAPFIRANGKPYLEPHHVRRVSDGGPDDPRYVAGVCPTCHRRIHHGADGKRINEDLGEAILRLERTIEPVVSSKPTRQKRVIA